MLKGKATSGGVNGDYEVPPAGNHRAVLVAVIDLGTHDERDFNSDTTSKKHSVFLVWEIDEKTKKGESHFVGRDYTLSFQSKANLRILLEKWRGRPYKDDEEIDITAGLGKSCLLSISHKESAKGNTYARVDGATALVKGMAPMSPSVKPFAYEIGQGQVPTMAWLPYIRGKLLHLHIMDSDEFKSKENGRAATSAAPGGGGDADEGPSSAPSEEAPF